MTTVPRAVVLAWLMLFHVANIVGAAESVTNFESPTRLRADGEVIDVGNSWGHAGPTVADVDGDGLRDLVVGDFGGKFRYFRNTGSNEEPQYARQQYLKAGDEDARVPIYCCIGSSPLLVDYDGDGKLDLLSGSYDPGECYLFRGLGDGKFAAMEPIVDKAGRPVIRKPDQQQKWESFGSWPATVDWDNDGDLDLLVGTFEGSIFGRLNEGSEKNPQLAAEPFLVEVEGEPLKLPSGHAAIAVGDWDADGLWDILSGCDSGAVYWFKNTGKPGEPAFAKEQVLLPAHDGVGYDELLEVGADPEVGIRTQIALSDYNADGKLDLLVGDFCTNISPKPDLTAEQREKLAAIRRQLTESGKAVREQQERMREEFQTKYPGEAIYSEEANAAWQTAYETWKSSDVYKEAEAKINKLQAEQGQYLLKPEHPGTFNEYATTHGYVWLFLRK